MTRSLTAGQQTEVAAASGTREWLLELEYYDPGTSTSSYTRLTTAAQNISADVDGTGKVTFSGTGGLLSWEGVPEAADPSGQKTQLRLSGVDTTILGEIDTKEFRGRDARIWSVQIAADGTLDFIGPYVFRQMGDYEVEEDWGQGGATGSCTITTTIESILSALADAMPVRCNVTSHNALLRRAGLGVTSTFFQNVKTISGAPLQLGSFGGGLGGSGRPTRPAEPRPTGPGWTQVIPA